MHMADALLSPQVGGAMIIVSASTLWWALVNMRKTGQDQLALMAVLGTFVFAAQMINFTIPMTGSSGHIGGGILLAALLGASPALIVIATVLIIQCLFFADGGLLAIGANIFNMGVLPCFVAYTLVYRPILGDQMTRKRLMIASIVSAIVGLQLGAFGVVVQTWASGVTQLPLVAFASVMQPIHLAIGLVEGLATGAIVCFVHSMRPELVATERRSNLIFSRRFILMWALCAALIAGGVSWFASSYPDGLEWSIERVSNSEFDDTTHVKSAQIQAANAVMPDYAFSDGSGVGWAGLLGVLVTLGVIGGLGGVCALMKRKKRPQIGV